MAKSIKQIADELGVTKTAVRKKIENLGLWSNLEKNGNQFTLDESQEKLVKLAFSENKKETNSEKEMKTVTALVSMLKTELEAKNEQIESLTRLLDQQQKLQAITQQRLERLEAPAEEAVEQPEERKPLTKEEEKAEYRRICGTLPKSPSVWADEGTKSAWEESQAKAISNLEEWEKELLIKRGFKRGFSYLRY
jgi:predicted ArsR family transcriptional regulator